MLSLVQFSHSNVRQGLLLVKWRHLHKFYVIVTVPRDATVPIIGTHDELDDVGSCDVTRDVV